MGFEETIKAWQKAAEHLQIKIEAPFILKTLNNEDLKFELLIKEFGSKLGTLILSTDEMTNFKLAENSGFYCSALNPLNYSTYVREVFIETLTDWGFYRNPLKKPEWYKGHIYN
jgi:hypothetical protein